MQGGPSEEASGGDWRRSSAAVVEAGGESEPAHPEQDQHEDDNDDNHGPPRERHAAPAWPQGAPGRNCFPDGDVTTVVEVETDGSRYDRRRLSGQSSLKITSL
jgi:hypothetical protein